MNGRNNLIIRALLVSLSAVAIASDKVFKIRKCCELDQHFSESDGCVQSTRYARQRDVYSHVQLEGDEGRIAYNISDPKQHGMRPWWFPADRQIFSRKTNTPLKEFPRRLEVVAGEMQPCGFEATSFIPTYAEHNYDFFDDGSLLVHATVHQPVNTTYDPMSYCVDHVPANEDANSTLAVDDRHDYVLLLCPCTKKNCILKCCGEAMVIDTTEAADSESPCIVNIHINTTGPIKEVNEAVAKHDWKPKFSSEGISKDYYLLYHFPHCEEGEATVIPNFKKTQNKKKYHIFSNGSAQIMGESRISERFNYCGDLLSDGGDQYFEYIIRCYPESGHRGQKIKTKQVFYGSLFIIGAFFLFLTLLISCLLPMKKNINDKNIISQTLSLFVGYVACAIWQLAVNQIHHGLCVFLGFLIHYAFLAAFFWLNVLCFDISWTFSELRLIRGMSAERNRKKFISYSVYGWGCPATISLVIIAMEFSPYTQGSALRPEISERCWFKLDSITMMAYFYGPIAVLLSANIIFFLFTLFKIIQAQRNISAMIKNKTPEKERLILYLKLFLSMGLTWVTELISWGVGGSEYFWYVTDVVNLLRAVFIFIIICCKQQVKEELKRRLGLQRETDNNTLTPNLRTNTSYVTN